MRLGDLFRTDWKGLLEDCVSSGIVIVIFDSVLINRLNTLWSCLCSLKLASFVRRLGLSVIRS